jgi:hypothetical protein
MTTKQDIESARELKERLQKGLKRANTDKLTGKPTVNIYSNKHGLTVTRNGIRMEGIKQITVLSYDMKSTKKTFLIVDHTGKSAFIGTAIFEIEPSRVKAVSPDNDISVESHNILGGYTTIKQKVSTETL